MKEKTLKTLEFFKILDKLKNKAISPLGKEMCQNLKPSINPDEIISWQKETSDAESIVLKKGSLPLGGIKDIRPYLKRVSVQGVLSIQELLYIGDFLHVVNKTIKYSKYDNKNDYFDLIENYFVNLENIPYLEKDIQRCILNENEISDSASENLSSIRKNIKVSQNRVREQLNNIIHSSTYKDMLQDNVITSRNGRFCVPIKQEYRNSFKGMIHDQSSTGQTLFIEPLSVVNLNNTIKELESEEKKEIYKILKNLSENVNENIDIFESNLTLLTYLDFVFAKGELSVEMKGTKPIFNTNGYVNIKKGRHPLLEGVVVPIDIYLGKDFTSLLITGPNTGGKTVSLKTLGLFTLMGQSGLHISAYDNSELAIFDKVFADIGDEQSIEQSLSTFSGHMTNIVDILSEVTNNSLVLFDELGAGTDPVEGAALAMSILQSLHRHKIRCAVTTHYSELKVYALSTEGVENAACEFDLATLRPTYKLLIGVPGKSNAFAISKRLGLSDEIIDEARLLISKENVKFEDLLTDLEISRKDVEKEKDFAESLRKESEKLKENLETQKIKLENQKEKLLDKAKREAYEIIEKANNEADELIATLQKQIKDKTSLHELHDTRNQLRSKSKDLAGDIKTLSKNNIKPIKGDLFEGDKVFVHVLNQQGTVVSKPDNNGNVMVQSGIMKMNVHISDLSFDESKYVKPKTPSYFSSSIKNKSLNIKPELDLRGNMIEEALEKIDKYLDDAYLSSLSNVTIIHGKGTGALRNATHDFLKRNSHIKSFRIGDFGEGDSGVTIVELK